MKTTLHHYRFDLTDAAQAAAYDDLLTSLQALDPKPRLTDGIFTRYCEEERNQQSYMATIRAASGKLLEVETTYLFPDQWNVEGLRVYPWYEMVYPNRNVKEGYWLEVTDEMKTLLRGTSKCGYCGHQAPTGESDFCDKCIGSEYLKGSELHLLRMVPVKDTNKPRAKLTEAEQAVMFAKYLKEQNIATAQRHKAYIAREITNVQAEYDSILRVAKVKYEGQMWLLNKGVRLGNVIYYDHKKLWVFGWRSKLTESEAEHLQESLDGFQFEYEIVKE